MDFLELFARQEAYQKQMGYEFPKPDIEACKQYIQALNVEQVELLNELPWKPWRNYDAKEFSKQRQIDEWTDSLIFLVNEALALQFSPIEVELAIERVFQKNYSRILNGISKLKGNETL